MCIVDMLFPSGWPDQLKCIETHCFQGGMQTLSDLNVFVSVEPVVKQFGIILDAMVNSGTGRRCARINNRTSPHGSVLAVVHHSFSF